MAPPNTRHVSPSRRSSELPRSASYTYISEAKEQSLASQSLVTIKGSFSEVDLIPSTDELVDISPPDSSGWTTPDEHFLETKVPTHHARDLVAKLQNSGKVQVRRPTGAPPESGRSSVASSVRRPRTSLDSSRSVSTVASTTITTPKPRSSVNSNFSRKLNRKSWVESSPSTLSRSPSPLKKESIIKSAGSVSDLPRRPSPVRRKSLISRKSFGKQSKGNKAEKEVVQSSDDQAERPVSRKSTLLRKKATRPVSGLFKSSSTDENGTPVPAKSGRPAVPPVPKSFSTDRLPLSRSGELSPGPAPMPRPLPTEKTSTSGNLIPKRKDELWSVFRSLDGDFTKFSSKSVAFKANVVRSSLLPFIRMYATHSSNRTLRAEDLDRRVNILNKWWTGLIEMLHGRNNQSISGTDRPVILDGISGIMERPEWRLAPSPFCPLNLRMKGTSSPKNRSTTSLTSNASDFLTDSVHHNVRNTFVQNLSAQMAFVVDKMSLRNASASLVTFCGKACAYAFTFVPGMADVLVRLWDLQMDTIRRVLEGNGVGKFETLSATMDEVLPGFPPALQQLGFSSLMKYMRKLRTPPPLPLGTANIQWWGHWLERWTGRESDLFYVFVKHFHILVTDFLPPDTTKDDRMCAPGLLLVHAQILTNLDATIHREGNQAPQDSAAISPTPTFDDVLADPDAVASTFPVPPVNATRLMAENRLIMLIRDFLSERAVDHPIARQLFAELFNDLLQTAARGTSMFDHAACYTLLDFLEEALILLVRFEQLHDSEGTLINPDFWKSVCKKMIGSQNTMTEIRLYSFLYTVWNTVVCDLGRKSDLCFGLLLDPEIFESRFNHWCPMVRAYFMRLLCWRVGRCDGKASAGDIEIWETLLERLQTTWCSYLFLREQAEAQKALLPATSPSNPAPSRRLLIIRTDPQVNTGALLSFDGIMPTKSHTSTAPASSKRNSTFSQVIEIDSQPAPPRSTSDSELEPRGRGLGGFFRNLLGTKSRSKSQGPARTPTQPDPSPPPAPFGSLTRSATEDLSDPRQRASVPDPIIKPSQPARAAPQHRNFSFKFSLEYHPNAKPLPPMRLVPPRLPLPAHQFLQLHSAKVNERRHLGAIQPTGESRTHARYCGRALAEWMVVLGECQSFFERRKNEGVPERRFVETPTLGVEVFRRPA